MDTNSSLSNQIFFVPLKTSSIQFNKKYISHYVSSSHALYSSPAILKSSRIALRSTNWSFYELKAYWLFVQFKSDNPAKDDDELSRSSEYRISAGPLSCSWWALVIATVTHKSILWGNIWVQIMIIFLWTIFDLIGYTLLGLPTLTKFFRIQLCIEYVCCGTQLGTFKERYRFWRPTQPCARPWKN